MVIEGGGDAADVAWSGNYFDDYAGYDLDRDGIGDVAYELRSFEDDLTAHRRRSRSSAARRRSAPPTR